MKSKGNWRSGFETVSNIRMFYRDWRPAGGESLPPVIALHGSLSQGAMWLDTAEKIGKVRFVCPDQRGYGKSEDPGRGDAAVDFAQDAIRLADALVISRYTVMGHSFAGSIALKVAAMDPDRVASVVLVDPTVRSTKRARGNLDLVRKRPYRFDNIEEALRFWKESEEGHWPASNLSRFVRYIMDIEGEGAACEMPFEMERLIRLREFQASAAGDYFPEKIAKKVKAPVLIFRGGVSNRLSSEGHKNLESGFSKKPKTVVCPKSGHFPPVQEPAIFNRALTRFIGGVN